MIEDTSMSESLREQHSDLAGLYKEARLNENGPLMIQLSKSMATLAKQIREAETYERGTLPRAAIRQLGMEIGAKIGQRLKGVMGDTKGALLIADVFDDILESIDPEIA